MNFYNLEKLVSSMTHNTTLNTEKEKVNWLKIEWMRFQKNEPYIMQYKYDQQETVFKKIDTSMKRGAGRKKEWTSVSLDMRRIEPQQLNPQKCFYTVWAIIDLTIFQKKFFSYKIHL